MNKPHFNQPQAFQNAPGLRTTTPVQQPARQVVIPAPKMVPPPVKRTHLTEPIITLRLPDRVALNAEAMRATPLRKGSCVEIIPPRRGGSTQWLLDTRSSAPGRLCQNQKGSYDFRTGFRVDRRYLPLRTTAGTFVKQGLISKLEFVLGPELTTKVCVQVPATVQTPAHSACEVQGTGLYLLLPRKP